MRVGFASGDWVSPDVAHDNQEHWGGSGWARLGQYKDLLPFKVISGVLLWNKTHFEIGTHDGAAHEIDVVVMQRLMHKGIADNIPIAQASGQKIINDLDDWYWGLSTSNQAFNHNHPRNSPNENTNHYRGIIARSNIVTVSTPYLADRIKELVKGEIVLNANTVDIARFTRRTHVQGTPVVGWVGSTNHRSGDLETLKGVLGPIYRGGAVALHHSGSAPNAPSFASSVGVPEEAVSTLPMSSHESYPMLMVMDIGIVPLSHKPFNRAKSAIKGLEYSAAGIPFIAQDLDAYVDLRSAGIGRIAKKPKDWVRHIKELSDYDTRVQEAELNYLKLESFDIRHGVARLADIINNV